MFSYKKLHQSTCLLVFSLFSAHFYPPLHHNGKASISTPLQFVVYDEHAFMPVVCAPTAGGDRPTRRRRRSKAATRRERRAQQRREGGTTVPANHLR